jgi:hypothetical protein
MKTLSIASFGTKVFAAIFAVASLSAAANAQFKTPVQVNVPFAFESGSQHLAAGVYTLQMDSEYVLRVQGKTVPGAAMSLATRSQDLNPAKTSKVVFKKYGNRYILSQVWIAGAVDHRELLTRKAEKQVREASNTVAPVNVELALVELPR